MTIEVRRIERVADAELDGLAAILVDCVEGGASVSFMQPLTHARAREFWRGVASGVDAGDRILFGAWDGGALVGTVQLVFAVPENQPHRADIAKMLVHRAARCRGIGERLMRAAESAALECGRTLLVLDTASDSAMRLYQRLGWIRVGVVPGYALWPAGGECDTALFYRPLAAGTSPPSRSCQAASISAATTGPITTPLNPKPATPPSVEIRTR